MMGPGARRARAHGGAAACALACQLAAGSTGQHASSSTFLHRNRNQGCPWSFVQYPNMPSSVCSPFPSSSLVMTLMRVMLRPAKQWGKNQHGVTTCATRQLRTQAAPAGGIGANDGGAALDNGKRQQPSALAAAQRQQQRAAWGTTHHAVVWQQPAAAGRRRRRAATKKAHVRAQQQLRCCVRRTNKTHLQLAQSPPAPCAATS